MVALMDHFFYIFKSIYKRICYETCNQELTQQGHGYSMQVT